MAANRIRVVLGDDVNERDYAPLAVRFRWRDHHHHPREGEQNLEWVMCTEDEANWIHYVNDHKLKVKYMLLTGPRAEEFARAIRDEMNTWSRKRLLECAAEADASREERREVLYQLAIDAMERGYDEQVFELFTKALGDSDPYIRRAAVLGASYLHWPELAVPLRQLATEAETDKRIRKSAEELLGTLSIPAEN